jgi:hypothetical protein
MPAEVTFSSEDKLIFIKYSGKTTLNDFQLATKQAIQYAKSHDCYRVLVDVSEIEPAVSPIDIYNMPELYLSLDVPSNVLIAMVAPKTAAGYDDFLFYETVCRNRGFMVETFNDMGSAKEWLTNQEHASTGWT